MMQTDNDTPSRPPRGAHGLEGKALAAHRREQMRRRAHRIRRNVASIATALFVAAFLGVYVQMASGHDPALTAAAKRSSSSVSTKSSATNASAAKDKSNSTGSSSSEADSSGEESSSGESSGSSSGETSSSQEATGSSSSDGSSEESASSVTTSQS